MFVCKNPMDKPEHHKGMVALADAGSAFAPILVKCTVLGFLFGVALVTGIVYLTAPDIAVKVFGVTFILIFFMAACLYAVAVVLRNKHKRYLEKYGFGD